MRVVFELPVVPKKPSASGEQSNVGALLVIELGTMLGGVLGSWVGKALIALSIVMEAPGVGVALETPGVGAALEGSRLGEALETPGLGIALETSAVGTALVAPGVGIALEIPGVGAALVTPGVGVALETPGVGTKLLVGIELGIGVLGGLSRSSSSPLLP